MDDKNGANKTTISKHIESIYGQLPAAHSTLLSHHLNRMKQSGELLLYKNNYIKPDPNAPPRRGRGRPPKAKTSPSSAAPSDAVVTPARPRGRPPKVVDPDAPATAEKTKSPSVSGRKRGRPKKSESGKRGRGRPPKEKPATAAAATAEVGA